MLIGGGVLVVIALFILIAKPFEAKAPLLGETPESTKAPENTSGAGESSGTQSGVQPAVTRPAGNVTPSKVPPVKTTVGRTVPEIVKPTGYTNTDPVLMKDLIGKKVILVEFWTYTSMNSMRTVPYLNQWHLRYKDKGLVILSIHTPRFFFEKQKDNVDKAAFKYHMINPIVLDSEYGTWNNWGNSSWPTTYLIDINGKIAYTHLGEGSYGSTEAKIQQLLEARAVKLGLKQGTWLPFETPADAVPVDLALVKSPEVYFGWTGNGSLANGIAHKEGMQDMKPFTDVKLNSLYLKGSWEITNEYAKQLAEGGSITYRYSAKNLDVVFGALKMNKVKVLVDGAPLTAANAGSDVRIETGPTAGSYVFVSDDRVYNIIKGGAYGEHTVEFVPYSPGLEAYVLMFS